MNCKDKNAFKKITVLSYNIAIFICISFLEPDEKAILAAAEEGDLEKIKTLLGQNSLLLECTDKDGYTPLHRACYGNHPEIVEVISLISVF